jgi:hypothetical protein
LARPASCAAGASSSSGGASVGEQHHAAASSVQTPLMGRSAVRIVPQRVCGWGVWRGVGGTRHCQHCAASRWQQAVAARAQAPTHARGPHSAHAHAHAHVHASMRARVCGGTPHKSGGRGGVAGVVRDVLQHDARIVGRHCAAQDAGAAGLVAGAQAAHGQRRGDVVGGRAQGCKLADAPGRSGLADCTCGKRGTHASTHASTRTHTRARTRTQQAGERWRGGSAALLSKCEAAQAAKQWGGALLGAWCTRTQGRPCMRPCPQRGERGAGLTWQRVASLGALGAARASHARRAVSTRGASRASSTGGAGGAGRAENTCGVTRPTLVSTPNAACGDQHTAWRATTH